MLYEKKSRWWPVALLAGFLVTIALPLLSSATAYAATTCSWTDASHITCNGGTFSQQSISGNTMTLDVPGSQCSSVLKVGSGSTSYKTAKTGQLTTLTAMPGPHDVINCVNPKTTTVTLSNTYNSVTSSSTTGTSGGQTPQIQCTILSFNPLNWFICPLVDAAQSAINKLTQIIDSMLTVDTSAIFGNNASGNGFRSAWSTFRSFAVGLIIIAGLIMLIAQGLSMDFIDAYTIRKVLPRMVVMIIFITLSWYVLEFLVGLSNDAGNGIRYIIYQPFINAYTKDSVNLGNGAVSVAFLVGAAGVLALGLVGLLTFVLSAFLALFVAFIVLLIRKIIIIMLVITAPLALACYILPNTERAWKFWKDTLISMLIVFPVISAMIAAGRVFAVVTYNGPGDATVNQITAFIAYFLPYFILPFAFKLAGGAYAALHGAVQNKAGGLQGGLQKMRQNQMAQRLERAKRGDLYQGKNPVSAGINAAAWGGTNVGKARFDPRKWKSRMYEARQRNDVELASELLEKSPEIRAIANDPDVLAATQMFARGSSANDVRDFLKGKNPELSDADIGAQMTRAETAQRAGPNRAVEIAADLATATDGTGWKDDKDKETGEIIAGSGFAKMADSIKETSRGDANVEARMWGQMRGALQRNGRWELAGGSFGAGYTEIRNASTGKTVNGKKVALDAFVNNDATTILRGKTYSTESIAAALGEEMANITANAPAAGSPEYKEFESKIGKFAAGLQNAQRSGVYSSPEAISAITNAITTTDRAVSNSSAEVQNIVNAARQQASGSVSGEPEEFRRNRPEPE